jgi:L-rhamnose-H+ transport protein
MDTSMAFAFLLVSLGGLLTGVFALPMKFITRWKWENIWLSFSFFGFVLIPLVVLGSAIPNLREIYGQVLPARLLLIAVIGYLWGLGAVTYGLSIKRLGIGLGSAFVLGISTLLGTLLPIFMANQVSLKWLPFLTGLSMLLGGIAICGLAGRDRELAAAGSSGEPIQSYASGLVIGVVSGVLSCLLNVGMVTGAPIQEIARRGPTPGRAVGNVAWPILLFGGVLANASYCGYLFVRNSSSLLYLAGGWREWLGSFAMGAAWFLGLLMYGAGAIFMGSLGPILGWPVFISLMVVSAYLAGRWTGEWRGVPSSITRRMNTGIALIVVSLFIIGYSR